MSTWISVIITVAALGNGGEATSVTPVSAGTFEACQVWLGQQLASDVALDPITRLPFLSQSFACVPGDLLSIPGNASAP